MAPSVRSYATLDAVFPQTTNWIIPAPAGLTDGDYMLAIIHYAFSGPKTVTPPAGWTTQCADVAIPGTGGGEHCHIFSKVAASEGADFTFVLSAVSVGSAEVIAIQDAATIEGGASEQASGTGVSSISPGPLTPSGAPALIIAVSCQAGFPTFTDPSGYAPIFAFTSTGWGSSDYASSFLLDPAAAENPTIGFSSPQNVVASIFAFLGGACDPPENDGGTAAPAISGTALEGQTLTLDDDGFWTGDPTITFTYQWYRLCGTVEELIVGETASTYVATVDDVGCNVFCEVTGTSSCGASAADSNQIGPIGSCPPPSNPGGTSAPVLTGSECVGDLVTVTDGDWFDVDSMTTYAYEWERVCGTVVETIGGETASTYTLDVDDVGCDVRCVVTATNACSSASETSNEIGPVNDVPTNTVPPVISGVPAVGHTLETTDGTWLNAGAFTYKWQRDCGGGFVDILGETAATYLITVADVDCYLRSVVTTTNACG